MRILGMMAMMMFLCSGAASAATINLNNGSSIQGDIIKQDSKSIQINVDGVTMTYYADEIKDVDGQPLSSQPAAAPQPEAPSAPAEQTAPADQTEAAAQPETPAQAEVPTASDQTAPADQTETAAQPEAPAQSEVPAASDQTAPADQTETAVQPETPAAQSQAAEPAPATSTIDPDKRALILKFIDVFGTRQALMNNFDLMIKQIEKEKPDEAQQIRDRVKIDEIIERLLPIYDRNFTSDDLKAFIDFYGSPAGQKLIGTIPELMKESVQESVKYMEEKFPEVKQGQ